MPELKEYLPMDMPVRPPAKKNKQLSTLILLTLILLGLLLVYWMLTRPPQVITAKATRGITNVISIYGASRKDLLREPNAVYVHGNGDIYVADTGNNRIVIFDSRGRHKSTVTVKKNPKSAALEYGDLATPLGVTVDRRGRIFTTSLDSGIIMFSAGGKKLRQWPVRAIQAFAKGDRIYITTLGSVYAMNSKGDIVQHIGTKGRRLGQFESPQDLTVDKGGRIIVSDSQNMRVQLFNKKGDIVAYKGTPAKGMGDNDRLFGLGTGITHDDQGRIYIADAFHHAIRIFDQKGNDLGEIGDQGEADGLFNYPSDIFFMGGNTFAVADKWNDRIQIVRINPGEARPVGSDAKPAPRGLPRWSLVVGLLILLAIIGLVVRRQFGSRRPRYRAAMPNRASGPTVSL